MFLHISCNLIEIKSTEKKKKNKNVLEFKEISSVISFHIHTTEYTQQSHSVHVHSFIVCKQSRIMYKSHIVSWSRRFKVKCGLKRPQLEHCATNIEY